MKYLDNLQRQKKLDQIWLFGKDWFDFISLIKYIKVIRPFLKHYLSNYEKMETNVKSGMNRSPKTNYDIEDDGKQFEYYVK